MVDFLQPLFLRQLEDGFYHFIYPIALKLLMLRCGFLDINEFRKGFNSNDAVFRTVCKDWYYFYLIFILTLRSHFVQNVMMMINSLIQTPTPLCAYDNLLQFVTDH